MKSCHYTRYMQFSPKYQDTNKACSRKLGVHIKKYDFFGRARECGTQISTMEPEDKKVVDRQHPFLSSSMDLMFFSKKNLEIFSLNSEWWVDLLYPFNEKNERNIHMSSLILVLWSRSTGIQKMRWLHMELSQLFKSPRNRFHITKGKKLQFFFVFLHIFC